MRHGLTLGELGAWFIQTLGLDVDYRVIEMQGWRPDEGPGYGWPLGERAWINPSPNAPNLWMARAYRRHGDGRGRDAVRRPRHNPAARTVRRAGHRRARRHRRDARARAAMARRLRPARLLVRADLPQARGQALQRRPGGHRGARPTTMPPSGPGASRRSHSRRSGGSTPTIRSGATSTTSTRSASAPSTSSTAGRCCASGWMTPSRRGPTSTPWPPPTKRRGRRSGRRS